MDGSWLALACNTHTQYTNECGMCSLTDLAVGLGFGQRLLTGGLRNGLGRKQVNVECVDLVKIHLQRRVHVLIEVYLLYILPATLVFDSAVRTGGYGILFLINAPLVTGLLSVLTSFPLVSSFSYHSTETDCVSESTPLMAARCTRPGWGGYYLINNSS